MTPIDQYERFGIFAAFADRGTVYHVTDDPPRTYCGVSAQQWVETHLLIQLDYDDGRGPLPRMCKNCERVQSALMRQKVGY